MTWNLPKIREACLELMGWKRVKGDTWTAPNGETCYDMDEGRALYVPNPTTSLDDALPLFVKFEMRLCRYRVGGFGCEGVPNAVDPESEMDLVCESADTASLAVSLCALRCAGHNLMDYAR